MPTKRDFYEVLGLTKSATTEQIKSAYKKMALQWHPDRHGKTEESKKTAEEKFKEINEAYQVLSDPKKKQAYDQFGHAAFDPASGMGGGGGNPFAGGFQQGGPFTWTYRTDGSGFGGAGGAQDFDFGDPFEIFEQFFGGGFSGFGGRQPRRQRYSLRIEFMEAVNGVTKEVEIDGKKHKIKVPAGANDGTRIRFDDFDITIDVKPDAKFKRDGYDVFVDHKVNFAIMALGGKIEVPTLQGKLNLKVRPGTQSHTLVRLRGEGIKHLQNNGKGDLYVRLIVDVPEKLNREQKQILEKLAEAS